MIAHWDDVESGRAEAGHLGGLWADLGSAAGSKTVGVNRIRVDPGKWSTPFHRQTAEEEIFYVLGGSGLSWQSTGRDEDVVCEVGDAGTISDPLVGRLRPSLDKQGGRGLWIANHFCDLLQIRSSRAGTRVRCRVGPVMAQSVV